MAELMLSTQNGVDFPVAYANLQTVDGKEGSLIFPQLFVLNSEIDVDFITHAEIIYTGNKPIRASGWIAGG